MARGKNSDLPNGKAINSQAGMELAVKSICDILRRDKAKRTALCSPAEGEQFKRSVHLTLCHYRNVFSLATSTYPFDRKPRVSFDFAGYGSKDGEFVEP